MALDGTYNTLNYENQGGDVWTIGGELNVESGGEANVKSGGALNVESGGELQFGGVAQSGVVRGDNYTVVAQDATDNDIVIDTGLSTIDSFQYHILRAGVNVGGSDEVVTFAAGVATITEDTTYVVTADDVVYWMAIGS
jgi:hypothetical protein